MNVGFVSLGCPKNQVDLEKLAGVLYSKGLTFEAEPEKCDILIVNTCGFIKPAVDEAISTILEMRSRLPKKAKLIAFGCMVERYIGEFGTELPEVDFYTGVNSHDKIFDYIETLYKSGNKPQSEPDRYIFNAPYYAYLKISEGCNNRCTYCTIPSIRGDLLSRPIDEIVAEAIKLAESGVKEIIIVSQDSSKYGTDLYKKPKLVDLLNELTKSLPTTLFRVMYMNPDGVTDEIIQAIKKLPTVIKYFDIPIQHISDSVLTAMARKSRKNGIVKLFDKIRSEIPSATIRTSLIVGFPNETEADFDELCTFIIEKGADFAGFFPYYTEDGSPSAKMTNNNDEKTVKRRLKELQRLQKKRTTAYLKKLQKEEIRFFVENSVEDLPFIIEGRALFQAPEVDGRLYVIDGEVVDGYGLYVGKIKKIVYPDIYVELVRVAE